MKEIKQPWIYSNWMDTLFILLPPFISLLLIVVLYPHFSDGEVSLTAWVILILLIDVAHVYTTLYRTYFDSSTFQKHKSILINIPLICWTGGVILYELDGILFWRILAYLAVYHFIRQQYGFMRIYSRNESYSKINNLIDNFSIYYATLYPIIYWHTHAPRNFHWFIEGDFIYLNNSFISSIAFVIYILTILIYLVKEAYLYYKTSVINIPKNLIVSGTFISWYFGIVYFNADLIFTTLNVVSHGIPYMALVWIYGRKRIGKEKEGNDRLWLALFQTYGLPIFLLIVFGLAYLEEGMWDGLIWKEHQDLFPYFSSLPLLKDKHLLALVIPLLSLPQVCHYVIDGFIWKISNDKFDWKKSTIPQ